MRLRAIDSGRGLGNRGWLAIGIASLAYLFVALHTPIGVYLEMQHDDGLFIGHALNVIAGRWMGPYDALTLAKGPGYPLFLVAGFLLGLPVTMAHAVLYAAAVLAVTVSFARLTRARWFAVVVFIVLLWHPAMLSLRVIRDSIYGSQTLLVWAALTTVVMARLNGRSAVWTSLGAGALFGWLWLTREEGQWMLPGIAFLFLGAGYICTRRGTSAGSLLTPLALFAATFALVNVAYVSINRAMYGAFVTVDFKESSFKRALEDLQGVREGDAIPHVPVPEAVRRRVYEVSPAFAELRWFLEDASSPGYRWRSFGCAFDAANCGDLMGGWFVWALRDAVADRGYYSSPERSSEYYRRLAREIEAACARGDLSCRPSFIPYMPRLTIVGARRIPGSVVRSIRSLLFIDPLPRIEPASENWSSAMTPDVDFLLGRPLRTPDAADEHAYELAGWYYSKGTDWFSFQCKGDGRLRVRVDRRPSPDIATAFHDAAAGAQRYEALLDDVRCPLTIVDRSGAHDFDLGAVLAGTQSFPLGDGTFYVDSHATFGGVSTNPFVGFALAARQRLISIYAVILPLLSGIGVVAFLAALVSIAFRGVAVDMPFVLAAATWCLVATRVLVVVLVDATAYPAISPQYLTPAYPLLCLAASSSIVALAANVGIRERPHATRKERPADI